MCAHSHTVVADDTNTIVRVCERVTSYIASNIPSQIDNSTTHRSSSMLQLMMTGFRTVTFFISGVAMRAIV